MPQHLHLKISGGHSPGNRGIRKSQGKIKFDENVKEKSGKFMKNCQKQGKVRENLFVLPNVLENVDIIHYISIFSFCQLIRAISVTFCYIADKLEKKTFQVREKSARSQGK